MADATKDNKDSKDAKAAKPTADKVTSTVKKAFDFGSLNALAVVSLATAATGFGAVAAIITGHVALAQLKTTKQSGRGLAIAGMVIGYATVAFWTLAFVFNFGAYLGGRGHMGPGGFDDMDTDGWKMNW